MKKIDSKYLILLIILNIFLISITLYNSIQIIRIKNIFKDVILSKVELNNNNLEISDKNYVCEDFIRKIKNNHYNKAYEMTAKIIKLNSSYTDFEKLINK